MKIVTPAERMKRLILALCDELKLGLRSFYAAKILVETDLRITPTLFDTFYFSCLDESCVILSRLVVAKAKYKDDSVNLHYLLNQTRSNPEFFRFSKPEDVIRCVEAHTEVLGSYKVTIDVLEEQRDWNLAHLDLRHIKQPEWRENQRQLDLSQVEKLYQDLKSILAAYHLMFFNGEINFGDWETISQQEVKVLIDYFDAYQLKT
jgi:hypothetical protein